MLSHVPRPIRKVVVEFQCIRLLAVETILRELAAAKNIQHVQLQTYASYVEIGDNQTNEDLIRTYFGNAYFQSNFRIAHETSSDLLNAFR